MSLKIAYQGEPGANSHIACLEAYAGHEPLPCGTFEDAFQAVAEGEASLAMIPIDNSVAGRVADIHHLLPRSSLHIVGEHFLPVHHQLMIVPEADPAKVRSVHSHVHALGQCRKVIRELGLKPVVAADTAGAARELSQTRDPSRAAIASRLAAEIYGLRMIRENIEDESHNTTRFVVLSSQPAGGPGRGSAGHHNLCVPCTERSCRPLQGHGRLRHQRRQHDETRILSDRGPVLGDAILCRHRGASCRAQRAPRHGGARILHQLPACPWHLQGFPAPR